MNIAEILLEISKRDLEAAKCLYQNKFYPQAVFYLQQSVEKAAKSFGLLAKMIDESELKGSIGHNPLRIHKKIMDQQRQKVEEIKKGLEVFPKLKKTKLIKTLDIERQYRTLKEFEKFYEYITKEKPIFISRDVIARFIEDLNEFELKLQELNEKIADFSISDEELDKMRVEIEEQFFDFLNVVDPKEAIRVGEELKSVLSQEKFKKLLKAILEAVIPMLEGLYIHLSLFYLAIITYPHAVVARYPEDELNPLEIYNEQHPLIQLFEDCSKLLSKTLVKIRKVKEYLTKLEKS